jgi:hypothetical protein
MTPEVRVEIAFGFSPYDPEPLAHDWIDVTEDVAEVRTKRGRESEFEAFPASTASVRLYNDERQYDPLNAAGTYYGRLLTNTPIRIVAGVSGTDYPVWRGYVDGWPAEYSEGGFASAVQVNCTDAFKLLAERPVPDTHLAFITDDLPSMAALYRCDTVAGQVLVNDGPTGRDGQIKSPLAVVDPLTPVSVKALSIPEQRPGTGEFLSGVDVPIVAAADNLTASTQWTVALVAQFAKREFRGLFSTVTAGGTVVVTIYVGSDGRVSFYIDGVGAALAATAPGVDAGDGLPHRIVLVRDGIAARLYIDGRLATQNGNGAATSSPTATGGVHRIGRTGFGDGVYAAPLVVIDELMVFGTDLSEAEVIALDTELVEGFSALQTSGSAVEAVLDVIGWPAGLRAIDAGETLVRLPPNPVGGSTLGLLQSIVTSEGGRLFVDAEGRVTFHARGRFLSETVENTVQYTFSDVDRDEPLPPNVGLLDGTLRIALDDKRTFDAAQVTRLGGTVQLAQASATPLRTYTASGLVLHSDVQAKSLAEWIVFRFGTAQARSDAWDIDPQIRPADWPAILTLDVGHRIELDLTPGNVGSSIELEQHLEYIAHDITPERWLITLNGSPVDPADYFLWAASATASTTNGWADTDGDPAGGAWG